MVVLQILVMHFVMAKNEKLTKALLDLIPIRDLILSDVNSEKTQHEIYINVHNYMKDLGYQNCHGLYPWGVLGHKVGKLPLSWLPKIKLNNFHPQAILYLAGHKLMEFVNFGKDFDPLWGYGSNKRCEQGLWAIEPHMGLENFGVKWEEILVVTENNAFWLDDSLPHVVRKGQLEKQIA